LFFAELNEGLVPFGFRLGNGGAHAARTMMLPELRRLLAVSAEDASRADYRSAVVDANLLGKPTSKARKLTFKHLCELYALNPNLCLFRVFRRLWYSDPEAQPVLALTASLARDGLLRLSASLILGSQPGAQVTRGQMETLLVERREGHLSAVSVEAIAQRLNGTWTQAGYLSGRMRKIRSRPRVTPANVAFALFLASLDRRSAQRLFSSDWARVLDLSEDRLIELAQTAAQRGLLVFRRTGGVMEVRFPGYLTEQEQEWLSEQA
jgi:hypothetical protein